ncbi:translation initiation factor IF-2 [Capnocytophaga cynodegmi]|uniref:Translation initiation factor IF-2 n=1 Tax=Capnocytophaga cynodegmi TaxID=28189 RepID=A0A0B7H7M1_9FLAO|nr:translation initiation factor IF-2 [Capnocytophaga cynodegmi]CEN35360.1 translation initiation factor IF-2 [Capnocytophaga cynodegmi]CEN40343.1 translation initiation factor IF-2 [Capnocytophaga cynodegmi]
MSEGTTRLSKVLKEFNISLDTAVDYLKKEKGVEIESNPNVKISGEVVKLLSDKFNADKNKREASKEIVEDQRKEREAIRIEQEKENEKKRKQQEQEVIRAKGTVAGIKTVGKIDLEPKKEEKPVEIPTEKEEPTQQVEKKDVETLAQPETSQQIKESKPESVEEKAPVAKVEPIVEKVKEQQKKKIEFPSKDKPQKDKPQNQQDIYKKVKEVPKQKVEEKEPEEPEVLETQYQKLTGPKLVGEKIDLSQFEKKKKKKKKGGKEKENTKPNTETPKQDDNAEKRKRKRIRKDEPSVSSANNNKKDGKNKKAKTFTKVEPTEEEVQKQVRETLEKLQGKAAKSKGAKYRKEKRDLHRQKTETELAQLEQEEKILKVTEFVTVNELATMMDVPINRVIGACMSLGIMVTMNQRLDAETLTIVADEFGFEVEFATADIEESIHIEEDKEEDLVPRAPIVTVMGHVDHGKTSLLDYIRKENVIAGESGGITQHIGAYRVKLESGERITFLDTPGHEAFTAMRARGTKVTDIAIIVVAADDDVMPQTKEAISHAQAAGVPIIFAINKIDKPTANPEKIKERLAGMNLLVEDWGGKIQSQDISAKQGIGVQELLEKVLLEAELLELKANPNKRAVGTVVEASLDRGRGYVSTVLVESGTLNIGDYVLAGTNSGKIRAMHDERGKKVKSAGPSTPISILGLDGAPQAGDKFYVFEDEREAKQIVAKRAQLQREQSVRTQRHITLDEIGRRIALGDFKQLNIILKGDVDGSVEALTDSFQKLSTEEIQVSIIHKGVGAITESDVLLASASDAIIIGFNVRPMANARTLADKEEIDIRTYSIIYDAINDLKDAMEGMLSPVFKEEVTGTVEIRELFKISKVGTIAGCMVTDGKIFRNSKIRIIRDGVVIYTGELASLKRFKDDVKEVSKGYDCGLQIKNYNDIKEGDVVEAFQEVAVKKKL